MTLRAQGFLGAEGRRGGVPGMLRRIGAVQLDTISVLARSHELVAYARLGPIPRERIERAYWHPRTPRGVRVLVARGLRAAHRGVAVLRVPPPRAAGPRQCAGTPSHERTCAEVLARLRAEGPLTATQLGGAKGGGPWWDWSDTKIAAEWLLDVGDVICVRREGWRRVYDLPERVLPGELLGQDPSDSECLVHLAAVAARALGVATRADLVDYQRLNHLTGLLTPRPASRVEESALAAGLTPVAIGGTGGTTVPAWADPEALAQAQAAPRGRHRAVLLSPFDSLVWDRKRTLRMFGFEHSLEAYVPKPKRIHGYFAMPLLAGGRLVGRVDPVRRGKTLVARQLSVDTAAAVEPMARALREAAEWVGCTSVELGQVSPAHLAPRLAAALA